MLVESKVAMFRLLILKLKAPDYLSITESQRGKENIK
jgi:hypothetical protein